MLKIPCNLRFLIRTYSIKVAPKFPINKPQKTRLTKATLQYPLQKLDNTNSRKPSTKSQWTEQQLQVLAAIKKHQSVFITGFAGTGKTYLIKEIIKLLCDNHGKKHVYVTGSTGVVACAIGGQTLHSFAGVGLAEADAQTLLSRVRRNKIYYKRWKSVKALVIDEISMVDPEFFDKLEFIARNIKENDEHWGGIQLVVSGDFSQLPPVNVGKRLDVDKEFAFEADSWDDSFQFQVCLTKIFRQSDPIHIRLLQGIRKGELDAEGLRLLEQCRSVKEPDKSVVRFYPRNDDVNRVNNERLNSLNQDIVVYDAYDVGKKPWIDQLERGIAPHELKLCVGARTMLTKNLDVKNKLVNGSTGTIIDFVKVSMSKVRKICNDKVLPMVKFDNGCVMVVEPCRWDVMVGEKKGATRLQLPLILAWALSIHKSQGMTVSRLHTDLSSAFGYGMVYVALSRVESLKGFSFSSKIDTSRILSHPKVLEYYKKNF